MESVVAALTWDPQVKGGLYVLLSVLILCGSCYLLLATNMGARLGFLLAGAGLFGFLATLGIIWWVYGIGPKGPEAHWKAEGIVTGELERSRNPSLERFPRGWDKIEASDPQVGDALPILDGELVGPRKMFRNASEYVVVAAYEKGGDTHGPFGLPLPRPFDVFHSPHYLAIQVQKAAPPAVGQRPAPDPGAQPVGVVLLRDLGAKRRNPAVFAISSMAIFLLFCYKLHVRDKQLWARQEEGSRSPQPVSR
jgi:hypothetical protein